MTDDGAGFKGPFPLRRGSIVGRFKKSRALLTKNWPRGKTKNIQITN